MNKNRLYDATKAKLWIKSIGFAILLAALMSIVACNAIGSLINPVIGTWQTNVLGVTVSAIFNADGSCTETNSLGQVGLTRSGTWTSASSIITKTWSDETVDSYTYSFNSDKSEMTLAPSGGGLSLTYTRQ